MTGHRWRPMQASDLGAVQAIADTVHPGFFEAPEVLAEKFALCPEGCLMLEGFGRAVGYIFTHPWARRSLPALNRLIGTLPNDAASWYIHDLALLPAARGTGAAGAAVAAVTAVARGQNFAEMSLVAVNGSQPFWQKQGFGVVDVTALAGKLAAYEPEAKLMEKRLV